MNNFSPSTDTSVGTKRFTAQEVQLAYTLMAVEYMKTIKGLNPNHQLVDKAVKLKALGFTNSKEVGDAITSEEDLKVLKCYSFLQRHFPGSLILKEEDFINLNVKYGLVVGRLSAYKGSVPDENIDEISKVMATAQALELKFNIAKHIIDVKLQEQEDRLLESEKKAKRQKILDLMAKKQDAELEGKSLEELAKELEALN